MQEQKKQNAKIKDEIAVELVEKLDYDFSMADKDNAMNYGVIARTIVLDRMVEQYLKKHENTDSREDILLTAYDLHGGFIGISIKLFCKFIAAVVVEISGVHIKNQLAVFDGIRFQTSGGDHAILFLSLIHN